MEYKIKFNDFLSSQSFLKEQFLFEKAIVTKQVEKCSGLRKKKEFDECKKGLKQHRKIYKSFVQELEDDFQAVLAKDLAENCSKVEDENMFIQCMKEKSDKHREYFNKMLLVMRDFRRNLLDKILEEK